jgi:hypothetical protein
MKAVILFVVKILPLIFGFGFVAPVIDQSLTHLGIEQIWGISTLVIGLFIGGTWGAITTKTGRWI